MQNYRYLNSWTIKNNYPLLLISDLIYNIEKKKVFTTSLLSLVPPSCMVVPVRDLGNKFTSFSSNTIPLQIFELLTVSHSNNTGMDFFAGSSPDNYDEMRGRSSLTKGNISRDSSMYSSKSSIAYHEKMELNNTMDIDVDIDDNSPALFYETS